MGDPAEENDPPPESRVSLAKVADQVNKKCNEHVTKFFPPLDGVGIQSHSFSDCARTPAASAKPVLYPEHTIMNLVLPPGVST